MTGLVIRRSKHAQEYVVVPNSAARDQRLTFTARGLHHYLLSLPPEWTFTVDQLAKFNPGSRQSLRSAMKELRRHDYVKLVTERGDRGRTTSHYEVYDTPPPDAARTASGPTSRNSVFPHVAPDAGRPAAGGAASIPKERKGGAASRSSATPQPPPVSEVLAAQQRMATGYDEINPAGHCLTCDRFVMDRDAYGDCDRCSRYLDEIEDP